MHTITNTMRTYAVLLAVIVTVSGFLALAVGLFEIPDAYYYVVLGMYITQGILLPVYPLHYATPSTLYGPLYSILVAPVVNAPLPWSALLIPFVQLVLLGI